MSDTPWAHLPNAKVIDEILADAHARSEVWAGAWDTTCGKVWRPTGETAWVNTRHTIKVAKRDATWDTTWLVLHKVARDTARSAAWVTISTLIAWDSSADLLALTPDALRTIITTCEGTMKHQAVLLLPAAIARHTT
jgi:hypothetical protein